ncbi:MAG: hypothetical protein LBJ00_16460 [Planctomycetaceae bacterium]|nr:hypothetical protein [Planctomycetaceae bacterium]
MNLKVDNLECSLVKNYTLIVTYLNYTEATLKFLKLNTQAQQREAVVQGRSLLLIPATV